MDFPTLERFLSNPSRAQRQRLELLDGSWRAAFERMDDEELLRCLRLIRKKINSKKLVAKRDELIATLRRDGLGGAAPLPKPAPPEPVEAATSAAVAPAERARNLELEAKVAEDPRAREAYLVYRDWLEAQGLVADGRVSLGPLAECDDMLTEVDWHLGFIRSCRLRYTHERFNGDRPNVSIEQALAWLLDDPGPGRFVRQLTIGLARHDDNDYGGVCEVIGRRVRPALHELIIGDFGYEECELNWSTIGDASTMWLALPGLRKLTLRAGGMALEGIDLPELRELETFTGGMPPAALRAIAGARWPKLERLALQIGTADEGAVTDVSLLDPLFDGSGFPALEQLGLSNCEFTDEICQRLPGSAILPRLRSLDLSMGTMGMDGVEALVGARGAFAHLERIVVDDNYLPPEARELLASLGPELQFGEQREDEGEDRRYASAFE